MDGRGGRQRRARENSVRGCSAWARLLLPLAGLTGVVAGCEPAAGHDTSPVIEVVRQQLSIARVPNPPLATDLANLPGDLRGVAVPGPTNLGDFVKDPQAALALGKALFWDMQVGSDGIQACASCHFRAGADPRSRNQLSPGLRHVPTRDLTYKTGGPNYQLQPSDFPLTRLATPGSGARWTPRSTTTTPSPRKGSTTWGRDRIRSASGWAPRTPGGSSRATRRP